MAEKLQQNCIIKEEDKSDSENENYTDEEESSEEENCEEENEGESLGIEHLLQHFLVNEDGENIPDVLSSIKKSLDIQNKILMKLLGSMSEGSLKQKK